MARKPMLLLTFFLVSNLCFAQTENIWTKTEEINPFEAKFFDAVRLLKPQSVKRYYKLANGVTENPNF